MNINAREAKKAISNAKAKMKKKKKGERERGQKDLGLLKENLFDD